ncbi:MAG: PQQ-dependent sugar dehydrogenase [Anaerolineae bacterium]
MIVVLFAVAACSTTTPPTPDIDALVEGTLEARSEAEARTPVTLKSPADGSTFDNVAGVNLEWDWTRPLADNEVFDLRVWRDGDPANGITWTRESSFDLSQWLLYQQPGNFSWTVGVLDTGTDDQQPKEMNELAPAQHFTMSQIRMDIMELPEGFEANLYARLPVTQPTVVTFGPDDNMYVLSLEGKVVELIDDDHDFVADTSQVVFDNPDNKLNYAVGMAFHNDEIYISDAGRISILEDTTGDGKLNDIHPIVEGLPTWKHTFHSNNGIAFGPDDKLYVGVGATTDHGPLQDQYEASILRMNPDGSDLEVFATGVRNPYDLTFSPSGDLFTADNSPDEPDETLTYLPPEEMDHIQQGKNYGFPYVYGFAGSGGDYAAPVTEFYTSSASAGLTYYDANQFPQDYHGVYVAQFGTGAGVPVAYSIRNGQMVVLTRLQPDGNGSYSGSWEPFAKFRTDLGVYSPIDVTVGPYGGLYIMEWVTSTVFRVSYTGIAQKQVESTAEATPASPGETLFRTGANGAPACITCHQLDGSVGVGPSLLNIGVIGGSRVAGLDAEAYARQSILQPNAYVVDGFLPGVMYQNYADQLTTEQVDELVAYVLSLSP